LRHNSKPTISSQLEGFPNSKPIQGSPHNLEGYNPIAKLPQHNEGKAQSQAKDRVYNLVVSNNNHKTISFSHTKSYRKDSRF